MKCEVAFWDLPFGDAGCQDEKAQFKVHFYLGDMLDEVWVVDQKVRCEVPNLVIQFAILRKHFVKINFLF